LHHVFLSLIAPVIGIGTIAVYSIATSEIVIFEEASNFLTSGGFGPNQVTSALSLGVLIIYLYLVDSRAYKGIKGFLFALSLIFATLSVLTFSRGGLYIAAGSILVSAIILSRDRATRIRVILVAMLSFLIAFYGIFPILDIFTQGTVVDRFSDISTTSRELIVRADMQIWRQNLLFGVGPGGSNPLHGISYKASAAHTEFSRMLSEHGIFGLVSLLILFGLAIQGFIRAKGPRNRGLVAAMLIWTLLFMLVNAMRIVAPAFLFGLAMNPLFAEESSDQQTIEESRLSPVRI